MYCMVEWHRPLMRLGRRPQLENDSMSSWVRYSVAVYIGLLLAGAAIAPQPQMSVGADTRQSDIAVQRPAHNQAAQPLQTETLLPSSHHIP